MADGRKENPGILPARRMARVLASLPGVINQSYWRHSMAAPKRGWRYHGCQYSAGRGRTRDPGTAEIQPGAGGSSSHRRRRCRACADAFEDEGGKVYLLDPDVKTLDLEYYDIPEDEKEGDWVSDWDPEEKTYLPEAVKFKLTLEQEGKAIVLPEIIVRINAQ